MDFSGALPILNMDDPLWQMADYTVAMRSNLAGSWNNLNFASGWSAYSGGGGYRPGIMYRTSGDHLEISGMVTNTSAGAVGSIIATLPAGSRPTYPVSTCVRTSGGVGFVHVDQSGAITYLAGSPASPSFVNINIILPLS